MALKKITGTTDDDGIFRFSNSSLNSYMQDLGNKMHATNPDNDIEGNTSRQLTITASGQSSSGTGNFQDNREINNMARLQAIIAYQNMVKGGSSLTTLTDGFDKLFNGTGDASLVNQLSKIFTGAKVGEANLSGDIAKIMTGKGVDDGSVTDDLSKILTGLAVGEEDISTNLIKAMIGIDRQTEDNEAHSTYIKDLARSVREALVRMDYGAKKSDLLVKNAVSGNLGNNLDEAMARIYPNLTAAARKSEDDATNEVLNLDPDATNDGDAGLVSN